LDYRYQWSCLLKNIFDLIFFFLTVGKVLLFLAFLGRIKLAKSQYDHNQRKSDKTFYLVVTFESWREQGSLFLFEVMKHRLWLFVNA